MLQSHKIESNLVISCNCRNINIPKGPSVPGPTGPDQRLVKIFKEKYGTVFFI